MRTNRLTQKKWVGILAAACLLVAFMPNAGSAARKSWMRTRKVAPGVFYKHIKDASGPYRIRLLNIKLSKPSTLDTVLATDVLPGRETTSSMAKRSGAIAAINGSYSHESGRPVYAFSRDGHLDQTSFEWGRNFAPRNDETGAYFGHPTMRVLLQDVGAPVSLRIDSVNAGPPLGEEIALFTPSGAWEELPPKFACSARLFPLEAPRLLTSGQAGARHVVDTVVCRKNHLGRRGGLVVSTPINSSNAASISSLLPGQELILSWSSGWVGVKDMVGGNPTLIEEGAIQWHSVVGDTWFHKRNPRTGVGLTSDGRVLLVAVDGRQPGYSVGMSLRRFAKLFESLGAEWAINLDGGGSTTFVLKGRVKNRPSDGRERPVSSSIVLLPGADPGETESAPATEVVDDRVGDDVWEDIVSDPASTGGLAAWLVESGRPLPPGLKQAAEGFTARSDAIK